MMTSTNVVELGVYRVRHKAHARGGQKPQCAHKTFVLDDNGHLVICEDCGVQIDAYFALRAITLDWGSIQEKNRRDLERMAQEKQKNLHLIAARRVEQAWRSKTMVPFCPHCGEGIRPDDGFGGGMISKVIDDARRKARQAKKLNAGDSNGADDVG